MEYPERLAAMSKEVRVARDKSAEVAALHREDQRTIRSQHDKICQVRAMTGRPGSGSDNVLPWFPASETGSKVDNGLEEGVAWVGP